MLVNHCRRRDPNGNINAYICICPFRRLTSSDKPNEGVINEIGLLNRYVDDTLKSSKRKKSKKREESALLFCCCYYNDERTHKCVEWKGFLK